MRSPSALFNLICAAVQACRSTLLVLGGKQAFREGSPASMTEMLVLGRIASTREEDSVRSAARALPGQNHSDATRMADLQQRTNRHHPNLASKAKPFPKRSEPGKADTQTASHSS
jgi:hypothetical protein